MESHISLGEGQREDQEECQKVYGSQLRWNIHHNSFQCRNKDGKCTEGKRMHMLMECVLRIYLLKQGQLEKYDALQTEKSMIHQKGEKLEYHRIKHILLIYFYNYISSTYLI
jgi:hypothetical protein